MHRRFPAVLGLALVATLATACSSEMTSPSTPTAAASGSGGGGGGGGGDGGGGGTPKPGRISRVSAGAVCDAGTSVGVTLDRGFQDRINVTMNWVASPTPVGPPIPPSTFPQTSLGGWWDVNIKDDATGALIMGYGSGVGLSVSSMQVTNLGRSVLPGTYNLTFTATKLAHDTTTGLTLPGNIIAETCTAHFFVVAR